MPNTKSAERRMRNSARKKLHNRGIKSRLHTLEKGYLQLVAAGSYTSARAMLRNLANLYPQHPVVVKYESDFAAQASKLLEECGAYFVKGTAMQKRVTRLAGQSAKLCKRADGLGA